MLNIRDLIFETILLEKLQKLDTEKGDNNDCSYSIERNGGRENV